MTFVMKHRTNVLSVRDQFPANNRMAGLDDQISR